MTHVRHSAVDPRRFYFVLKSCPCRPDPFSIRFHIEPAVLGVQADLKRYSSRCALFSTSAM